MDTDALTARACDLAESRSYKGAGVVTCRDGTGFRAQIGSHTSWFTYAWGPTPTHALSRLVDQLERAELLAASEHEAQAAEDSLFARAS